MREARLDQGERQVRDGCRVGLAHLAHCLGVGDPVGDPGMDRSRPVVRRHVVGLLGQHPHERRAARYVEQVRHDVAFRGPLAVLWAAILGRDGELAALSAPGPGVVRHHDGGHSLPIGALALFVELRARIHGLVMLELLGHLYPFDEVTAQLFDTAIRRMSDDTDAAQRATGATPPDLIPSDCGSN